MPTVCLLFNSATAVGDCIFTQFSYLLNIQRKLWDDGDALSSVREKRESWPDTGIGAGLFVADPEVSEAISRSEKGQGQGQGQRSAATPAPMQNAREVSQLEQSAYYTRRGGKYLLGSWDPRAPQYADTMKNTIMQGRRQRTYTNNEARNREPESADADSRFFRDAQPGGAYEVNGFEDDFSHVFQIDTRGPRVAPAVTPHDWMGIRPTLAMDEPAPSGTILPVSVHAMKGIQRRISNLGLGARGAALLLAGETRSRAPSAFEDTRSGPDPAMYTATDTASVDSDDENLDDSGSSPVVLPSKIIADARKTASSEDADPTHAHYSDVHHFDLIEKERKAMQIQLHRQRHMRMGRDDKENEMLRALGASGVVPPTFLHAKLAHRKSISDKLNVLNLSTNRSGSILRTPIPVDSSLAIPNRARPTPAPPESAPPSNMNRRR
jgi:hypothetical protein